MSHKIEVFSAGCKVCSDTINTVKKLAGLSTRSSFTICRARRLRSVPHSMAYVPAVLIDGNSRAAAQARAYESVLCEALV